MFINLVQDSVKTRLRCDVLSLVSKSRYNLSRWYARIFALVTYLQNTIFLGFLQLIGRRGSFGNRALVHIYIPTSDPALIGPGRYANGSTARFKSCAFPACFIDQLNSFAAIRDVDHSSSVSPQIASAFFRSTKRAAVSAKAFSFLLRSRSE